MGKEQHCFADCLNVNFEQGPFLKDLGEIPEGAIPKKFIWSHGIWWKTEDSLTPLTKVIYLKASPNVSYNRIKKRCRQEENTIPLEYIEKVSNAHDTWLSEYGNVTIIDADKEFENDTIRQNEVIKLIFDEIDKLLV